VSLVPRRRMRTHSHSCAREATRSHSCALRLLLVRLYCLAKQLFKRGVRSVGACYVTVANLPREQRYLPQNVALPFLKPGHSVRKSSSDAGLATAPQHARLHMFMQTVVGEFRVLESDHKIAYFADESGRGKRIGLKAFLLNVSADGPATRDLLGHAGCTAKLGCTLCWCAFTEEKVLERAMEEPAAALAAAGGGGRGGGGHAFSGKNAAPGSDSDAAESSSSDHDVDDDDEDDEDDDVDSSAPGAQAAAPAAVVREDPLRRCYGAGVTGLEEQFEWQPRKHDERKRDGANYLRVLTDRGAGEAERSVTQKTGIRYSPLVDLLKCFDSKFHAVDPPHTLFLGVAKHLMHTWLAKTVPVVSRDGRVPKKQLFKALLGKKELTVLQTRMDALILPTDLGRVVQKLESNFAQLTANEVQVFISFLAPALMHDLLPLEDYDILANFSRACRLFVQRVQSEEAVAAAHALLTESLTAFKRRYPRRVVPNMHYALHIADCIRQFGPFHGWSTYAYERFNGILKSGNVNAVQTELTLMARWQTFRRQLLVSAAAPAAAAAGRGPAAGHVHVGYTATSSLRTGLGASGAAAEQMKLSSADLSFFASDAACVRVGDERLPAYLRKRRQLPNSRAGFEQRAVWSEELQDRVKRHLRHAATARAKPVFDAFRSAQNKAYGNDDGTSKLIFSKIRRRLAAIADAHVHAIAAGADDAAEHVTLALTNVDAAAVRLSDVVERIRSAAVESLLARVDFDDKDFVVSNRAEVAGTHLDDANASFCAVRAHDVCTRPAAPLAHRVARFDFGFAVAATLLPCRLELELNNELEEYMAALQRLARAGGLRARAGNNDSESLLLRVSDEIVDALTDAELIAFNGIAQLCRNWCYPVHAAPRVRGSSVRQAVYTLAALTVFRGTLPEQLAEFEYKEIISTAATENLAGGCVEEYHGVVALATLQTRLALLPVSPDSSFDDDFGLKLEAQTHLSPNTVASFVPMPLAPRHLHNASPTQ
jgi:hypothetical protein